MGEIRKIMPIFWLVATLERECLKLLLDSIVQYHFALNDPKGRPSYKARLSNNKKIQNDHHLHNNH
ncbi:hypothetical protein Ga0061065_107127 [Marinomonas fungiae]|uniref:Uncharacterized protein n=1 Tax=Marinomonas fungiae TaxID=1137284 RepID=A0A0K6IN76_9GAMM|nr:hypothetical protein Ga0061065_107127 [Marinomonas fungiae]